MTANILTAPNHLALKGNPRVGFYFGAVQSVHAVGGCHPHACLHFHGGLVIDLDPDTITELAAQFPKVLHTLETK